METAWIIWLALLAAFAIAGWRCNVNEYPQESTFLGLVIVTALIGAIGFPFISFLVG